MTWKCKIFLPELLLILVFITVTESIPEQLLSWSLGHRPLAWKLVKNDPHGDVLGGEDQVIESVCRHILCVGSWCHGNQILVYTLRKART